jgi:hypothetical protein
MQGAAHLSSEVASESRRTHLFKTIELKLLVLYDRAADYLRGERGQTTSEYVAVTAVAVAIAMGVLFVTLGGSLNEAVQDIASRIETFAANPPAVPNPNP